VKEQLTLGKETLTARSVWFSMPSLEPVASARPAKSAAARAGVWYWRDVDAQQHAGHRMAQHGQQLSDQCHSQPTEHWQHHPAGHTDLALPATPGSRQPTTSHQQRRHRTGARRTHHQPLRRSPWHYRS